MESYQELTVLLSRPSEEFQNLPSTPLPIKRNNEAVLRSDRQPSRPCLATLQLQLLDTVEAESLKAL